MKDRENNNPFNEHIYILVCVGIIVAAMFYIVEYYFKYPAIHLLNFTHKLTQTIPFISYIVTDNMWDAFMSEVTRVRYTVPEGRAIKQLNVSLVFYYPLLFISILFLIKNYLRATKPYTFKYKITKVGDIVNITSDKAPSVLAGYIYGSEIVKNPALQKWGTYSQEYGPIRYCIKNRLVSFQGQPLIFKELSGDEKGLIVEDSVEGLKEYAGRLDININKLKVLLKGQLGRKIQSVEDLTDPQIALCKLFLTYAKGSKSKSKAQEYRDYLARSCVFTKVETANEIKTFKINRSNELSDLKELVNKLGLRSKILKRTHYDRLFVLSCYHIAKSGGADITPPEFNWLKAFERETFLLLHTFTGDPEVYKNNGYIEIVAALNNWLDIYKLVSLDKQASSDEIGLFEYTDDWQNVLHNMALHLKSKNEGSNLTLELAIKPNEQNELSKVAIRLNRKESLSKSKILSKYIIAKKISKKDSGEFIKYRFNTVSDQLFVIVMHHIEKHLGASNKKRGAPGTSTVNSIANSFRWLSYYDSSLFLQIVTASYVLVKTGLGIAELANTPSQGAQAEKLKNLSEIMSRIELNITDERVKLAKLDLSFDAHMTDVPITLGDGWTLLSDYISRITEINYSPQELSVLAETTFASISQSTKSVLYYLTHFEKWLKAEYYTPEDVMLGTPSPKINANTK